ncbi:MAG: glycine--tRNA ligase subunit beta [Oceanospirillaceae bacterium]|nr:glycine--tRNA ligase subunit beta [Oceanospirillaceae bacterium]MCP5334673.1 glycine--tRNA ligase subunit beta [Oceanospirillaceae bacterium]
MKRDFLVEIGTEELPPKALKKLAEAFQEGIESFLKDKELSFAGSVWYAAPRRLALRINGLAEQGAESKMEKFGPYVNVAFDANGNPSKAAEGFAKANNITMAEVGRTTDAKGERLYFAQNVAGVNAVDVLADAVNASLAKLPIPKRMRWGNSRNEFVRPVQWVVMLFGNDVVPGTVLGMQAGNQSKGHRFHHNEKVTIANADAYLETLRKAYVMADFAERRARITEQVTVLGKNAGGQAVIGEDLLDEVTALNEWPTALAGRFEERFLTVPPEALISSMKEHQKYFHVVDASGKLLPSFITVCNIESKDPAQVIAGNEKVIRPRLSDAAFFWNTDRKTKLEDRVEKLGTILWVNKLGTLKDKSVRLQALASKIAAAIGGNSADAQRAALLCKTDLVTDMVGEFDDMQGLAGFYYAQNDGEKADVAAAMKEQYMPAFAGDQLPATQTGIALAIADRLDSLVGLFGIGQIPTGTKDPYALRRASLGVLRILVEKKLDLDLNQLIDWAIDNNWPTTPAANTKSVLMEYMLDRFSAWYGDENIPTEVFQAVRARGISNPLDINQRVQAVNSFAKLDAAQALAAANKRVSNILAKVEGPVADSVNAALLQEDAEKALASAVAAKQAEVKPLFANADYNAALTRLADLRETVDTFFDKVMVMADDAAVKNNRLALLKQLRDLFLEVADISLLQTK